MTRVHCRQLGGGRNEAAHASQPGHGADRVAGAHSILSAHALRWVSLVSEACAFLTSLGVGWKPIFTGSILFQGPGGTCHPGPKKA